MDFNGDSNGVFFMDFNGGFNCDLMGFNGDLWWFNGM